MKKKLTLFFTLILFASFLIHADIKKEKRNFEISDLYKLRTISGIKISPDKKYALFALHSTLMEEGKSNSHIFLLNLKSNGFRQMTFGKSSDSSPFWSKDSKNIYFCSSREKGRQLWIMPRDGGEPRRISDFYTGIFNPVLSSDSKYIYFTSSVFLKGMNKSEINKKLSENLSKGTVQAHMADSLLYRHWDSYRDWQYVHTFRLNLKTGKTECVTQGKHDFPCSNLGSGAGMVLSPDSKEVCIVANFDKKPANSTNSDLIIKKLSDSEFSPVNITKSNRGYDGSPKYSPDGKYIAFTRQKTEGYEADRKVLMLYSVTSGKIRALTESIDNNINQFRWSDNSKHIYFTVQERGRLPLYKINIKNLRKKKILSCSFIRDFHLITNKKILVYRSSVKEPYELWTFSEGKKNSLKRVSFFNKQVEDNVDIRPAEEHWVRGADNKKIHVFIVKPHNFDPSKKYPLIMNVHGGPQMQWSDSFRGDWQVYPGKGYVVAFPNPHGSTGYGQEFTSAISRDWNGKVIEDIYKVSDYLAELPFIDKERMGAMGWSWGGYAMMWLEGHNRHFKALAAMMGVYDLKSMYSGTEELWFPEWDLGGTPWDNEKFYKEASPSTYVKNFSTPCLVITGERDYRVPYTQSIQFFTDLQKMGVESRLIVFKEDCHWPSNTRSMPVYYNAHLEWFSKHLKGGKAPWKTEDMIRNQAFKNK